MYSFCLYTRKFTLTPIDQAEICMMQAKAKEKNIGNVSLLLDKTVQTFPMTTLPHLVLAKESETGKGELKCTRKH